MIWIADVKRKKQRWRKWFFFYVVFGRVVLVGNNNCHSSEPGQSIVEHRCATPTTRKTAFTRQRQRRQRVARSTLIVTRNRERESDMIRDQGPRLKRTNLDNKWDFSWFDTAWAGWRVHTRISFLGAGCGHEWCGKESRRRDRVDERLRRERHPSPTFKKIKQTKEVTTVKQNNINKRVK